MSLFITILFLLWWAKRAIIYYYYTFISLCCCTMYIYYIHINYRFTSNTALLSLVVHTAVVRYTAVVRHRFNYSQYKDKPDKTAKGCRSVRYSYTYRTLSNEDVTCGPTRPRKGVGLGPRSPTHRWRATLSPAISWRPSNGRPPSGNGSGDVISPPRPPGPTGSSQMSSEWFTYILSIATESIS